MLSTLLLSAAAFVGIASALDTRACTVNQPTTINRPSSDDPSGHSTFGDLDFVVSRDSSSSNTEVSIVTFDKIPAGATGCTLQVQWPALTVNGFFAHGYNGQSEITVDVYTLNTPDTNGTLTWDDLPVPDTKVSQVNFPTVTSPAFQTNLVSGTCSSSMSYLFEIDDFQSGPDSVEFTNRPALGFSLIYNC